MCSKEIYSLSEILGKQCIANGYLLVTAESCTGGLLAKSITDIPGSSLWFEHGFITYSNKAKIDYLGISDFTLDKHGAVSQETADEMAIGAFANGAGNMSISITGIAGPDGGSENKPVGLVYVSISTNKKTKCKKFTFTNKREINRKITAYVCLSILKKKFLNK